MTETFGNMLKRCRRNTRDKKRGGFLSQERFAELISEHLKSGVWPYPQTVSDWERSKYQPDAKKDRKVLIAIVQVLLEYDGLTTIVEADALLASGGYSHLTEIERIKIFGSSESKMTDSVYALKDVQIRLLSCDEAHEELIRWVLQAKKEIRGLAYYLYDWGNCKDIYDTNVASSDARKRKFDTLYEVIQRAQNSDLRYIRIVEAPSVKAFTDAVKSDQLYYRECRLLSEIGKKQPEDACLQISDVYFRNTFYLVDRTHLLLYIDVQNPDSKECEIPFTVAVIDPTGEQMKEFVRLHQRIEAHSILVSDIDSPGPLG